MSNLAHYMNISGFKADFFALFLRHLGRLMRVKISHSLDLTRTNFESILSVKVYIRVTYLIFRHVL